jgi:hypothetical protein
MRNCRPFMDRVFKDETPAEREKGLMDPARELGNTRIDMMLLIETTRLFYPSSVYKAVEACLEPNRGGASDFRCI